jgi:alkylation response protein AidB-like acyl-CoA dehydrogenase
MAENVASDTAGAGGPADAGSLLARVERSAAVASTHRDWAEANGRLADEVVEALVAAGIPRLYLPESLGGLEVDPVTCAEVTGILARADSAAGWFVMVANSAKLMAAGWPEETVTAILAEEPDVVIAASGNRPYRLEASGDGYLVNGVNSFVSGCHHARWLLSAALLDGQPRMILLPMNQCEIVDNWHSLGMRGTGSNDVEVSDVWIPSVQAVEPAEPGQIRRNRFYQGALYRCPGRIIFATYVPVTLTLADRALAELDRLVSDKTPYAEAKKLRHRSIAQIKGGRALAVYRAAHGYFHEALRTAWERAEGGREATPEEKADLYLAGTHAVQSAADVVRLVADAAGTSVIYQGHPLERIVRDMETLRHHGFANESRYGSVSQLRWGAELDYPLMLR